MRLIDADALKEGIKELKRSPWYNNDINPSWKQGIKDAVHVVETLCIDEEPTVEAVPVIRCRDCKHNRTAKCPMYIEHYEAGYGYSVDVRNEPDDFCSLAEPAMSQPETGLSEENQRGTIK